MSDSNLIAIGGVVVGALGFLWGVYVHYSSRRTANLFYEVNQLSDYGIPESFVAGLGTSLIAIRFVNEGNAQAKDIVLDLKTNSDIQNYEPSLEPSQAASTSQSLRLDFEKLNPSQEVRVLIYCEGNPVESQVKDFGLTHSAGSGLDRKDRITKINFRVLGFDLTYDLLSRTIGFR